MVRYGRFADASPPERELLDVAEDGSATAWRSIAPVGGRFAGSVPDVVALRALVDAAVAAGPVSPPARLLPDGVAEEVSAGGLTVTLPLDDPPTGPWADLAAACRAALEAVSSSPGAAVAAVGSSVAADGALRLEHHGREELTVELGSMRATLTLWRNGVVAWSSTYGMPAGLERTAAGPGWTLDVRPSQPVPGGAGTLVAQVDLVADDAGVAVPLTLTAHTAR